MATFWRLGFAVVLLAAFAPHSARSDTTNQDQRLEHWGNAALRRAGGPNIRPVRTDISDHFGRVPYSDRSWWRFALANGGRKIPTAGSGSFWVYDPVHHIAAVSQGGGADGEAILYAPNPPLPLPARDLSTVASMHGLRLGISAMRAAKMLGVSGSAVKRMPADESVLYARKDRTCGTYRCANDATVLFRNHKAVAIALYDVGP